MLLKAPAKINLTLKILSKRADAYHEICSQMCAIRLFDEVEIALGLSARGVASGRMPRISVSSDLPDLPDGPDNLAYRAAEKAMDVWGEKARIPVRTVDIKLKKRIPAAAGLAGGSADAAAVLLGLANELARGTEISEIAFVGAGLGADVPFCVYSCAAANPDMGCLGAAAAVTGGIGDRICPLPARENAKVLLVKPPVEVSTKKVYELFDARKTRGEPSSDNDLEASCAQAFPVVGELIGALKALCDGAGAKTAKVQLSGSGPTVFAYFDGADANCASRVYARAKETFSHMFVCLTDTL